VPGRGAPVHGSLPTGLVELCRARSLPLLLVPRETPPVAVGEEPGRRLARWTGRGARLTGYGSRP